MGCCSSCLEAVSGGSSEKRETEMQQLERDEAVSRALSVSRGMSAPSIDVEDRTKISGHGLALAAVPIEQDAAYWECVVEGGEGEVLFGVATRKDRKFYEAAEHEEEATADTRGTALMSSIAVRRGDCIGVTVQQDDLPMVQFHRSGEQLSDKSVNRFRGTVYPAAYLPEDGGGGDAVAVRFIFREKDFQQSPPSSRFLPVMVARGLV